MIAPDHATLLACCASTTWADAVLAGAPYANLDALLARGEALWWAAGPDAWRAALAAHPRIGDRPPAGTVEAAEQCGAVEAAAAAVLEAIDAGNAAYEQRFGMTYVVRARGRSAAEMLALQRERMTNTADEELRVAAGQQWEITVLRLRDAVGGCAA